MAWVAVAKTDEVKEGALKGVEAGGNEIVLCNVGGKLHAVSRRCGHQNAPLEMGVLEGTTLTCPMHGAQFDVATGKVIAGPHEMGPMPEGTPEAVVQMMEHVGKLMAMINTHDLATFPVQVEGDAIEVQI